MRPITATPPKPKKSNSRRGTVILIAMVCLLLVMMIGATLMKAAQAEQNQIGRAQSRLQADWLVEAAIERAAAHLANDSAYAGEVWKIPAEEMDSSHPATVTIEIKPTAQQPDHREINIVADYPLQPEKRTRSRKRVLMNVGNETQ